MAEIRLNWEPLNTTPLEDIEERLKFYVKNRVNGVTLLGNGSVLFTKNSTNHMADAELAMKHAAFMIDFQVVELKLGGFLVDFQGPVTVFVGQAEFESQKEEIRARIKDLLFPEEYFFNDSNENKYRNFLVGLYARGKLQYDAHHFCFYKRIEPQST